MGTAPSAAQGRDLWAEVAERAAGRWPEILAALGVPAEILRRKHSACPGCGSNDGFRFPDLGSGKWFCSAGGANAGGDGFGALGHVLGWDKRRQLEEVSRYLGISADPPTPEERAAWAARRRESQKREAAALRDRMLLAEVEVLRQALRLRVGEPVQWPSAEAIDQASVARWARGRPDGASAYLDRKMARPFGVRFDGDEVLVPMRRADGMLFGVQRLLPDGGKRFPKGLDWHGLCHVLGPSSDAPVMGVAEGYATAASVHEAMGYPVACVFVAGNLLTVALALRDLHPRAELVFFADWDGGPAGGAGVAKARAAAEAVGGLVLAAPPPGEHKQDWNDVARAMGAAWVRDTAGQMQVAARAERRRRVSEARDRLRLWLSRGG